MKKGNYVFSNVEDNRYSVIAAHVGLQTQSVEIAVANGETKNIDFTLKESAEELQEVIVTGTRANNRTTNLGKLPVMTRENPAKHHCDWRSADAQPAGTKIKRCD